MQSSTKVNLLALSFLITTVCSNVALGQSLRQEADKIGLLVGAAVNPSLFSEPRYARTLAREFNMVEPDNVMKWPT
ncbi:MAG TPA: endo-1,4-beta-xylanase, partial [Terriglobia bacterium]|nr:endo-1,4-beta-xylanase [Terriglobia bacterium]